MSIAKYIKEFNQRRDERIKKNQEYIDANPYPIDELNALDKNSAIAKLYNENGEILNASQFRTIAASENPDLYKRLDNGNNTLRKIKQNEELNLIDPSESLNNRYAETLKGIARTGLTFNQLINTENPSEFEEAYDSIMESAGISGIDASPSTVMLAFKELNKRSSDSGAINDSNDAISNDKESSVLNDDEISETSNEGSKLGSEVEIDIEPNSEVEYNVPELEREVKPAQDDIQDSNVSPLNDNISNVNQTIVNEGASTIINDDTNNQSLNQNISSIGGNNSTDSINTSVNTPVDSEYDDFNVSADDLATARQFLGKSSSTTINEESKNINQSNSAESTNVGSANNFLEQNIESNNSTNSINTLIDTPVDSEYDDFNVSADDLATARQFLGKSSSATINEESKNINQSNSAESTNADGNKTNVESTEITKNKIGIDKKIAPINIPAKSEPISPDKSKSQNNSVNITEVASESGESKASDISSTSSESSTVNNKNKSSETNVGGDSNADMSEVNERLRKIENLLSSPLEVKIVD